MEIQHSLRCTASVQCKGTHSLGIGLKRLTIGQTLPGIESIWHSNLCTSLSAARLSISCLAIFRIRPVTGNSLHLLPGYVPYTSVTCLFYQRVRYRFKRILRLRGQVYIALRVCTLVLFIGISRSHHLHEVLANC